MTPTIGRIVHFKRHTGDNVPAIITAVTPLDNGEFGLTLTLFLVDRLEFTITAEVMAAGPDTAEDGQWWWPERV